MERICMFCGVLFSTQGSLNRHLKNVHHEKCRDKIRNFECDLCKKKFLIKKYLKTHLIKIHGVVNNNRIICKPIQPSHGRKKLYRTKCPTCGSPQVTHDALETHLAEEHEVFLQYENCQFNSSTDFDDWRVSEENKGKFRFVVKHTRPTQSRNTTYYHCHCSGDNRRRGSGKYIRFKPSIKINKTCPVRLIAVQDNEIIRVTYCKTHVGHVPSIKDGNLRKEERVAVAGKIAAGVKHQRILDDIRKDGMETGELKRVHLLDKRDLYNISRDFKLDTDKLAKDDFLSTQLLISEDQNSGEDASIIFVKNQGEEDGGDRLKTEDFILVLMSKFQEKIVTQYLNDKVLVDSTHGMTGYDFQVTTLVTVDEYGAGCPVAMCLSNRIDSVAMEVFFNEIKKKVGPISSTVFMSDDAPAYYNAWCAVMGQPMHHLLCTWHVDRSWKGQLNKIKDPIKRKHVYHECRTLQSMETVIDFNEYLDNWLKRIEQDDECRAFGEYLKIYYLKRVEQWAYCYRRGLGLNTNMYLESLHRNLKHCYLDGKKNRRVDKCVKLLMNFSRNMMFEWIIRQAKNTPSYRMSQIAASHRRSLKIKKSTISQTEEFSWSFQSSTSPSTIYKVEIWRGTVCDRTFCPMMCPECRICPHQASCTCEDYAIKANMCKHIHALPPNAKRIIGHDSERNQQPLEDDLEAIPWPTSKDCSKKNHLKGLTSGANVLQGWIECVPEDSADDPRLVEAMKQLEGAIEIVKRVANSRNPDLSSVSAPSHSKITPQRFTSAKKKRMHRTSVMLKPTPAERNALESHIISGNMLLNIHSSPDHNYEFKKN